MFNRLKQLGISWLPMKGFSERYKGGFPSKFSLNKIRKNERLKFFIFAQNCCKFRCFSTKFSTSFLRKFFILVQFSYDKKFWFFPFAWRLYFCGKKDFEVKRSKILTNLAKISNEFRECRESSEWILRKFRTNFSNFGNFAKISNKFLEVCELRQKILTKIFAKMNENFCFHLHFRWPKFSQKRLNENLETLIQSAEIKKVVYISWLRAHK